MLTGEVILENFTNADTKVKLLSLIQDYVSEYEHMQLKQISDDTWVIEQILDKKYLTFCTDDVESVLTRTDLESKLFLQVNFKTNKKILITEKLIGFKPLPGKDLDPTKLPKVVTTQDLLSVYQALEETLFLSDDHDDEFKVLKKIFEAVISGGEDVGITMSEEKGWIARLPRKLDKISA